MSKDPSKSVGGAPLTASTEAVNGAQNDGQPFKPTLSVSDMVVYGLITMVPIAPMAIYGGMFKDSNGMPALAYLIGFIAVFFCILSFGVMIKKFPSSGSIYTYATHVLGKPVGFIGGWLMLFQYLVTPTIAYLMAGIALHAFMPAIPVWAWCLMFLALVSAVMLRGMNTTMAVNRGALIAELVILGLFLGFGASYVLGHPDTSGFTTDAFIDPEKFNISGAMSAVSLAMLSYIGFGSIATLTEDAKDKRNGPPKAMLIMVLILLILFVAQNYMATCIDPTGKAFADNSDNAFYNVAKLAGGMWLSLACAVMVALSQGLFTGLTLQTSCSLILYSMSKSGALPKGLMKTQKKSGLPINAVIFTIGVSLVLIFLLQPLGLDNVAKVGNFSALATYVVLNVCVIAYAWIQVKERKQVFRHLIFPVIGAVICFWILLSLGSLAVTIGAIWIVIGVIYYCVLKYGMHRDIQLT